MNIVAHNLSAMNAQRQFGINTRSKAKSTEKLSSGYKINRAADDAAGLAISEKMRRQIRGLTQGVENTQDGVSLCQVADGALAEVNDMLHRITELSVKSANGTNTEEDRQAIQEEINQILREIDRIGNTTTFNERKIFTGQTGTAIIPAEYEPCTASDFSVTGTPTDTVAMSYNISADTAGFSINGDAFTWSEFKSGSNTLADNSIVGGTYSFNYHGFTISLSADNGAKLDDVVAKLDGASFATKTGAINFKNKVDILGTIGKVCCTSDVPENSAVTVCMEKRADGLYGHLEYNGMSSASSKISYRADTGICDIVIGNEDYDFANPTASAPFDGGIVLRVNMQEACTDDDIYNTFNNATVNLEYIPSFSDADSKWYYTIETEAHPPKTIISTNPVLDEVKQTDYKGKLIKPAETIYSDEELKLWIQSGCEAGQGMFLEIDRMNNTILGINDLDASTVDGANHALEAVKGALQKVSSNRAKIGAQQNRLEHTIANEENVVENTTAAEARIRDTDMAKEMVKYSNINILEQVGHAMMAQANQSNQGVLNLLQ